MKYKNIEERIQKIIHDCNFKFRKGFEAEDTINTLKYIIIEIAKSNDALGKIAFMKGYYSELFEDSRTLYFVYQTNCNKLDRLIENHRDIYGLYLKDFVEEIISNKYFDKIFEKELPNLHKIIKNIYQDDEDYDYLNDIMNCLDVWINIISYEETSEDFLVLLDDEFKELYLSRK